MQQLFCNWKKISTRLKGLSKKYKKRIGHCFAMPNRTKDYKNVKTTVFVNSMKGNGKSINWSQDWKFVSGVSYASMVCANLTGIGKSKPKKFNNATINGRKERSPMLIVEQDLNNIKRPLVTKKLVYKSKASENCNVRAKFLCSQNVGQCVPTFNRFKVLEDTDTIQTSNKNDMGFHSDVYSKVT